MKGRWILQLRAEKSAQIQGAERGTQRCPQSLSNQDKAQLNAILKQLMPKIEDAQTLQVYINARDGCMPSSVPARGGGAGSRPGHHHPCVSCWCVFVMHIR